MSLRIAVRELCEFTAKEGDLDLRLPRAASVELAVAMHLAKPDAPVHYVENTLICGLFGHWPEPGSRRRHGEERHGRCALCQRGLRLRDGDWILADEPAPAPGPTGGS